MRIHYTLSVFLSLFMLFQSCNRERTPLLPNITGKAGEVVLVVNANLWENRTGNAFVEFLASEVEVLPQSEPMFNPVNIPWTAFTNIFKTHRNLILLSLNPDESQAKMIVRRNVWARPQLVIEITAPSDSALANFSRNQSERIVNYLLVAERDRIIENYRKFEKSEIGESLISRHQLSLVIPAGYSLDVETDNFLWIANETPRSSQGVFVYYYNYEREDTFTPEFLISKRNEVLKANVPGPVKDSYMSTEMIIPPMFREYMKEDRYFAEVRGLWKVENDFMGGPFVSITTLDEKRNRVITVEGFVYMAAGEKRNLLRQVEAILHTLEIVE
jgi:hypothetical protein